MTATTTSSPSAAARTESRGKLLATRVVGGGIPASGKGSVATAGSSSWASWSSARSGPSRASHTPKSASTRTALTAPEGCSAASSMNKPSGAFQDGDPGASMRWIRLAPKSATVKLASCSSSVTSFPAAARIRRRTDHPGSCSKVGPTASGPASLPASDPALDPASAPALDPASAAGRLAPPAPVPHAPRRQASPRPAHNNRQTRAPFALMLLGPGPPIPSCAEAERAPTAAHPTVVNRPSRPTSRPQAAGDVVQPAR